ncbi:MAG: hypothetical protein Kow0080_14910 [Candidatus Promineifilaceae bacterium]
MATPEALARQNIDRQLAACGWIVQDRSEMNLWAERGVAVREFPLQTGFADYLLFVDRQAVGVIEAKKEGVTLSAVADQAALPTAHPLNENGLWPPQITVIRNLEASLARAKRSRPLASLHL